MKKLIIISAFVSCIFSSVKAQAQTIESDGTFLFAQKDTCELFMDIYKETAGSETTFEGKAKPTIIFMFGGGFKGGDRNGGNYLKWFRKLNDNGYKVVTIDYRLGLKDVKNVGVAQVNTLDRAIHMAVEDLYSATNFIIENKEQLGIDPYNMVISGSSAGAIAVMQAEYELANRRSWAEVLPEDFRYAGVMSFAGAILSKEGKVNYAKEPAPTLMLHGTADKVVPYKQIKLFHIGFFGGEKLTKRFEKFGYNYNMYHYLDNGHIVAGLMEYTLDLQLDFIETNIIKNQKRVIEAFVNDPLIIDKGVKSRKELYNKK